MGVACATILVAISAFAAYGGVGQASEALATSWETVSDAVTPSSEVTIQNGTPAVDQYGKGDEGCTPGFWKQEQHFDEWTGASPGDDFNATFGVTTFPGLTLLDALNLEGGGAEALARAAVAALLNAQSPGVAYAFTAEEVKAMVKAALDSGDPTQIEDTKNTLDAANNGGCPLD